jgi:hypothetical protein
MILRKVSTSKVIFVQQFRPSLRRLFLRLSLDCRCMSKYLQVLSWMAAWKIA